MVEPVVEIPIDDDPILGEPCTYRHPVTGAEVHLTAQSVMGPASDQWWRMTAMHAMSGDPTGEGGRDVRWYRALEDALDAYQKRLGALQEAGLERIR
jgi:hypothetical protein